MSCSGCRKQRAPIRTPRVAASTAPTERTRGRVKEQEKIMNTRMSGPRYAAK